MGRLAGATGIDRTVEVAVEEAIVRALAARNSPAARQALARIAAEGQGEVREAAQTAVTRGSP